MQVVVDSLLTHYETRGEGKVVVLLHGWGDRAAGLEGLQTELAKDFQVIAVDLPGFGGTQSPNGVWGLDGYAQFVRDFLAKISAPSAYCILGHSNGGAIAIRGLAQRSLKSQRLILMASAGIRGEAKGRLKALKVVAKTGKVITAPLPASTRKRLRAKLYGAAGSDMLVAEHLQETFKKVVSEDVRADAHKLTLPTLLLYGSQDTATPPRFGEMYHELIAKSVLKIIPGAGHFIHLEKLPEVSAAIKEFLK